MPCREVFDLAQFTGDRWPFSGRNGQKRFKFRGSLVLRWGIGMRCRRWADGGNGLFVQFFRGRAEAAWSSICDSWDSNFGQHGWLYFSAPGRFSARRMRWLSQRSVGNWVIEDRHFDREGVKTMLSWALTFLVIALIAAALGFGGIAGTATSIAKILFFVFLVLFVISLLAGGLRRPVV